MNMMMLGNVIKHYLECLIYEEASGKGDKCLFWLFLFLASN